MTSDIERTLNLLKRLFSTLLAFSVCTTSIHAANATAIENQLGQSGLSVSTKTENDSFVDQSGELKEGLSLINSIPEIVLLQGDAATQNWIETISL
ncbi:MAG: hypothetical protein SPK00_10815 [Corynebacterium glucuronolyticum]|nr:hypothetical protein [Corynebacterium glucuronolyticum]MDD7585464.1 hypothetical protein [Mycobacteriaceae bacterium]MDY5835212.1 hypothetical protein [Corynebacterium glucuronolyticum]